MNTDAAVLEKRIHGLSNEDLLRMLLSSGDYRDDAIAIAKQEAHRRDLGDEVAKPNSALQQIVTQHAAAAQRQREQQEQDRYYQQRQAHIRTRFGFFWRGIVIALASTIPLYGMLAQKSGWGEFLFATFMFAFCIVASFFMLRYAIKGG